MFLQTGWGSFLRLLEGHNDEISLLFAKGFDGKMAKVGHLTFSMTEESIALATKFPREGARWHKHLFLPWTTHEFALRVEYQNVANTKGYHREWIKLEYLEPLTVIIWLITCEGKYTIFKSSHLILLAH